MREYPNNSFLIGRKIEFSLLGSLAMYCILDVSFCIIKEHCTKEDDILHIVIYLFFSQTNLVFISTPGVN